MSKPDVPAQEDHHAGEAFGARSRALQVVADAEGLTSRAGTALLAGLADRVGLTAALSQAMAGVRERRSRHDPGRALRDLAVMLADGGDCLADLRALRDQATLFGEVASDATAWRALAALDEERLAAVRAARATARGAGLGAGGRARAGDPRPRRDAGHRPLRQGAGAAGTYKGGFGFHPLLCYEATSEEALAGILRPGNAGANTAADHIERARPGARAAARGGASGRACSCAADSGGATHAFLDHVAARGLRFSVGFDLTEPVRQAILALPEQAWRPALDPGRRAARRGRLGRRARPRPLGLAGGDARDLPPRAPPPRRAALLHRPRRPPLPGLPHQPAGQRGSPGSSSSTAHRAVVEDRIRCGKDTGLATSPSAPSSRTPPGSSSS